jgi:hypothetical protein
MLGSNFNQGGIPMRLRGLSRIVPGSVLAVLGFAGGISPAGATILEPIDQAQLIKDAQLIFVGVVTRIDYRLSEPEPGKDERVPHSFVTYRIESTLLGKVTGQPTPGPATTVTLRFLGGENRQRRRWLTVEGSPLFDVGDRDVLFVKRNGKHICPLVGWNQGRFRVIGGEEIFTDRGEEVWLTSQQILAYGAVHDLEEVLTHHRAPGVVARLVHSPRKSDGSTTDPDPVPPIQGQRLSATAFLSYTRFLVAQLLTPSEQAKLPPVESADPDKPFVFRQPAPVPAPPEPTEASLEPRHLDGRLDGKRR